MKQDTTAEQIGERVWENERSEKIFHLNVPDLFCKHV